jgi:SAM-dependent methyltransferase
MVVDQPAHGGNSVSAGSDAGRVGAAPSADGNTARRATGPLRRVVSAIGGLSNDDARHRWVIATLQGLPAGARLLDVGAGECRYRPHCSHLQYVSQDFGEYDGSGDARGLQTETWDTSRIDIISDITAIPEADASYDAVLCTEVLEHVPDPVRALAELCRLVKPGGELILTAPFASLTHFAPYHFCSGFNSYFYRHWLPRFGLEITELTANGNYFSFLAQELKRVPDVCRRNRLGLRGLLAYPAVGLAWLLATSLSRSRPDSAELLCFGYHVRARRSL